MSALAIRAPQVVAQEIDGEVIAINLDTGAYYSFRGVASVIWQHVLAGPRTGAEIVAALRAMYPDANQLEPGVEAFLAAMRREELFAQLAEGATGPATPAEIRGAPDAFAVPVFEKHTDMEEFLLVDPIHDLDVSDWPAVEPPGPTDG